MGLAGLGVNAAKDARAHARAWHAYDAQPAQRPYVLECTYKLVRRLKHERHPGLALLVYVGALQPAVRTCLDTGQFMQELTELVWISTGNPGTKR